MPAHPRCPFLLRRAPRHFAVLILAVLVLAGGSGVSGASPPRAACNNTGGGECVFFFLPSLGPLSSLQPTLRKTLHSRPALTQQQELPFPHTTHRWLIADSAGFVCPRTSLNPASGCCDGGGSAFSCATCDVAAQCCTSYEHCVSCCLKPGHPGSDAGTVASAFRARNHPETGHWASAFDFCAGTCRTTRESTAHENAFISPAHFCFSASGVPRYPEPDPEPPALAKGLVVVAAEAGKTCDAACEAALGGPLACAHGAAAAAALSDCNALRAHFPCEAGCLAADDGSTPAPAYVLPTASKALRPAACLTLATEEVDEEEEEEGEEGGGGNAKPAAAKGPPPPAGCDAAVADMRRLCACVKGKATAEDG
jgi:hypothetical protein